MYLQVIDGMDTSVVSYDELKMKFLCLLIYSEAPSWFDALNCDVLR